MNISRLIITTVNPCARPHTSRSSFTQDNTIDPSHRLIGKAGDFVASHLLGNPRARQKDREWWLLCWVTGNLTQLQCGVEPWNLSTAAASVWTFRENTDGTDAYPTAWVIAEGTERSPCKRIHEETERKETKQSAEGRQHYSAGTWK